MLIMHLFATNAKKVTSSMPDSAVNALIRIASNAQKEMYVPNAILIITLKTENAPNALNTAKNAKNMIVRVILTASNSIVQNAKMVITSAHATAINVSSLASLTAEITNTQRKMEYTGALIVKMDMD